MSVTSHRAITPLSYFLFALIFCVPTVVTLACDEGLVLDVGIGQRVNFSIPVPGQCKRAYFEDANSHMDAFEPYKSSACSEDDANERSLSNQSFALRLASNTTLGLGRLIFFCGEQAIHCATLNITDDRSSANAVGSATQLQVNCQQQNQKSLESSSQSPSQGAGISGAAYASGGSPGQSQQSKSPSNVATAAPFASTSTSGPAQTPSGGVDTSPSDTDGLTPSSTIGSSDPSQPGSNSDRSTPMRSESEMATRLMSGTDPTTTATGTTLTTSFTPSFVQGMRNGGQDESSPGTKNMDGGVASPTSRPDMSAVTDSDRGTPSCTCPTAA